MSKIVVKDLAGPASSSNKIYIASGSELDIANSTGTINLAVDAADITTGTLSDGRLPADIPLQIVTASSTSTSTTSTSGTSYVDAGVSGTITPSSTASKIFIFVQYNYARTVAGGDKQNLCATKWSVERAISGGATTSAVIGGDSVFPMQDTRNDGTLRGQEKFPAQVIGIDSPNTTSAVTYQLQFQYISEASGAVTVGLQDASTMILIEYKG
jgi:hypothetical protein